MPEKVPTDKSAGNGEAMTAVTKNVVKPEGNNTSASTVASTVEEPESSSPPKEPIADDFWSTILQSPSDLASFSPSKDIISDGNLHGLGLQLATERSKSVGRFGHRTAAYLLEIATVYERFGKVLVKASHSIHPDVWKVAVPVGDDGGGDHNTKNDDSSSSSSSSSDKVAQSCYDSVRSMGMTSRSLAEYYRTRLVAPLKTNMSANRAVLDTHGQRYVAARAQCFETRRRALAARTKLVKAVHVAEKSFRRWKKARASAAATAAAPNNEGGSALSAKTSPDAPKWEKAIREYGKAIVIETDQLVKALHDVEAIKSRYEELVENENDAVEYAQNMEAKALEAIQGVEKARVSMFLESVVKPICAADADTLRKWPSTAKSSELKAINGEASALDLKKGKDLLANIFARQAIGYEEGMGRTDAETLGLPLAIGYLRDDVKRQVAGIGARIKAAQILTEFLGSLGTAMLALEAGLKIDSLPMNARQEPLGAMAFNAIGPAAADMWKRVVKTFEDEAVVAGEFASTVTKLRLQKLDVFLETSQKDLKTEKEYDDTNWKTLCEIARAESKAAARYRQVRAQQEKARERVLSVDMAKGDESSAGVEEESGPSTPQKNRMSKALFAGGEVMKKFQENARIAMAKNGLLEAEQNAAKEQQILDEATSTKSQASLDYKRVTEIRAKKLEAINKQVKKDFEKIMEAIELGIGRLQKARIDGLDRPLDGGNITFDLLIKDVNEWLQSAKDRMEANRKIAIIDEGEQHGNDSGEGFKLSVRLYRSEPVDNLLQLDDSTLPPPEFIAKLDDAPGSESSEDELDVKGVDSSFDSIGSSVSASPSAQTANGNKNDIDPGSISIPETPRRVPNETRAVVKHSDSNFEGTTNINSRKHESHDVQVFIRQFWHDKEDFDGTPNILHVISCAYRPKEKAGFLIPPLHGRLYTTAEKLYFLAMDGKNFELSWQDVIAVTAEKRFMGTGDGAVLVTYNTTGSDAAFVLSRLESKDDALAHLQKLLVDYHARSKTTTEEVGEKSLPPVPQDSLLHKMEIVLSKQLKGVSITQIYEKAWSEGNRTSEKPFYGPWLDDEECFDISVEDWEFAEPDSEGFVGPWCKERYTQRRLTTFRFKRSTHLYIGPPIAFVKQMHYCKVEGNDKCVVAISATFEGIPYSDAFAVEMRWVARRLGANDLDIKVGLEVDFKKSTMLKSQIRSGTIAETKNVHMRMFDAIKRVCQASADTADIDHVKESTSLNGEEEEYEDEELDQPKSLFERIRESFALIPVNPNFLLFAATTLAYPVLLNLFSALLGSPALSTNEAHRLNTEVQELRAEVRELRASLDLAIQSLKKQD